MTPLMGRRTSDSGSLNDHRHIDELNLVSYLNYNKLERGKMGQCHTCGNIYDKSFEVILKDVTFTFDSFECAIQALAPACGHCQCRVIGHGVEARETVFCCAHCAHASGISDVQDRSQHDMERTGNTEYLLAK